MKSSTSDYMSKKSRNPTSNDLNCEGNSGGFIISTELSSASLVPISPRKSSCRTGGSTFLRWNSHRKGTKRPAWCVTPRRWRRTERRPAIWGALWGSIWAANSGNLAGKRGLAGWWERGSKGWREADRGRVWREEMIDGVQWGHHEFIWVVLVRKRN